MHLDRACYGLHGSSFNIGSTDRIPPSLYPHMNPHTGGRGEAVAAAYVRGGQDDRAGPARAERLQRTLCADGDGPDGAYTSIDWAGLNGMACLKLCSRAVAVHDDRRRACKQTLKSNYAIFQ